MNRNRIFQAVVSLVILMAGFGGMYSLASRGTQAPSAVQNVIAPLVTTVKVEEHEGSLDIAVDGTVAPFRDITVAAEVPGRVVLKADQCRAGRFVEEGTLLLQLDDNDYRLEEQRLEKQLEQADSNLQEVDVEQANIEALIRLGQEELALQEVELKRVENLRGNISDSDVDKVRRSEWSSRNSLQTLRNQLQLVKSRRRGFESGRDLAKVQLEKARLDRQRTRIVATIDGLIVQDFVEEDTYVQKGTELLIIEDTSRAEVKCNLQMTELTWVWRQELGEPPAADSRLPDSRGSAASRSNTAAYYELPPTPVTISFQPLGIGTRYQWQGVLSRLDGLGVDGKTRTVPCRVLVTDPRAVTNGDGSADTSRGPPALLRGMYVTVVIHAQPGTRFLRVPEIAVQPGKRVFRVRNNRLDFIGPVNLIQLVTVANAEGEPRKVWLLDSAGTDLRAGDAIITSPVPSAYNGMAVRSESRESMAVP